MSTPHALQLVIADDHALYRRGLRLVLTAAGFDVIGEASDGDEAVELVRSKHPDVVILDVRMPRMSGLEAARLIAREVPAPAVVVTSAFEDPALIVDALGLGVASYLSKDADSATLVAAIRQAAEGLVYIPPGIARRVLEGLASARQNRDALAPDLQRLTDRELKVMRLLTQGKRVHEIAQLLGISDRTVGKHTMSLYAKLHVHHRPELVLQAVRAGLVDIHAETS